MAGKTAGSPLIIVGRLWHKIRSVNSTQPKFPTLHGAALSQNSRFLGEDGGQFGPPRSNRHRQVAEWRTPCSINLNSLSGIDLCRETGPPHVKFRLADQVTWRCSARQSVHCEAAPREKESHGAELVPVGSSDGSSCYALANSTPAGTFSEQPFSRRRRRTVWSATLGQAPARGGVADYLLDQSQLAFRH